MHVVRASQQPDPHWICVALHDAPVVADEFELAGLPDVPDLCLQPGAPRGRVILTNMPAASATTAVEVARGVDGLSDDSLDGGPTSCAPCPCPSPSAVGRKLAAVAFAAAGVVAAAAADFSPVPSCDLSHACSGGSSIGSISPVPSCDSSLEFSGDSSIGSISPVLSCESSLGLPSDSSFGSITP